MNKEISSDVKRRSKHLKYKTKNIISKYLVNIFYKKTYNLIKDIEFNSIADLGCGEGHLLSYMKDLIINKKCFALDFDVNEVNDAKNNLPFCDVRQGSLYKLPFDDNSFDLVICTEVLEHLEDPNLAISEICRVSKQYVLLSVPNEPLWRLMNVIRFAYIKDFGNTPGHINHWSINSFKKFVLKKFKILQTSYPTPWIIFLTEKH